MSVFYALCSNYMPNNLEAICFFHIFAANIYVIDNTINLNKRHYYEKPFLLHSASRRYSNGLLAAPDQRLRLSLGQ